MQNSSDNNELKTNLSEIKTLQNGLQDNPKEDLRSKIVGLGEGSLRKSYFPQLQKQIKYLSLAKEKAEENEKKFSMIFNSTSDAIILVDINTGGFYLFNRTACRMFAYSHESMESLKIWNLFPDPQKSEILEKLISNSIDNRVKLRHIEMKTSFGEAIYCDINTSSLEIDGNTYIIIIFRDITELAKAEHEKEEVKLRLLQAQKMEAIGTLAGGIAHDFNNILSGIFGYSRLAGNYIKENNSRKALAYIDNILNSAQKAADLIRQILTFSRRNDPEQQQHPMTLSIAVKETLKLLRSIIPTTIEIKVNIESTAKMMADPTKIHQLLMNLCTNAYHAMSDSGGLLAVNLRAIDCQKDECIPEISNQFGKYLELEISDTGSGIDSNIKGKIFDPYFTTKKEGQGTGLGLAIVHVVVQEHKGYIKVDSELGKGTTFRIYFPVVEKNGSRRPASDKRKESTKLGTESIMLIDDEQMILDVTKAILEGMGYKVFPFISSIDALNTFESEPNSFNLIITDMTMPQMEGDKFATAALKIRPNIPIILCTGYSHKISEELALEIGIKRYVEKPLITKNLEMLIRDVLDTK
ncbi:MAG: PAS domain S-box protein [Desulfamplus sp.]|nr:PAS domain S-box protein [Desulfamplus sp.]